MFADVLKNAVRRITGTVSGVNFLRVATGLVVPLTFICFSIIPARITLYFPLFDIYISSGEFRMICIVMYALAQLMANCTATLRDTTNGVIAGGIFSMEMIAFPIFLQSYTVAGLILTAVCIVLYFVIMKFTFKVNNVSKRSSESYKKKCVQFVKTSYIYALCVLLTVPLGISIYKGFINTDLSAETWNQFIEWYNEYRQEETTGQEKSSPELDRLSGLRRWDELDIKEKERAVRAVAMNEQEYLGLADNAEFSVETQSIDEYTYGEYVWEDDMITINYKLLNEGGLNDILTTVLHEMHHRYVMNLIHTLDFKSDEVKNGYYYQKARDWYENNKNYISASVDYDLYYEQPIEADARAYADERISFYTDYIDGN